MQTSVPSEETLVAIAEPMTTTATAVAVALTTPRPAAFALVGVAPHDGRPPDELQAGTAPPAAVMAVPPSDTLPVVADAIAARPGDGDARTTSGRPVARKPRPDPIDASRPILLTADQLNIGAALVVPPQPLIAARSASREADPSAAASRDAPTVMASPRQRSGLQAEFVSFDAIPMHAIVAAGPTPDADSPALATAPSASTALATAPFASTALATAPFASTALATAPFAPTALPGAIAGLATAGTFASGPATDAAPREMALRDELSPYPAQSRPRIATGAAAAAPRTPALVNSGTAGPAPGADLPGFAAAMAAAVEHRDVQPDSAPTPTIPITAAKPVDFAGSVPAVDAQPGFVAAPPFASAPTFATTAPAATAVAPVLTVATHPTQLAQDVGASIGLAISRGAAADGNTLHLRLEPAELGRIDVSMSFGTDGHLRAVVGADSAISLDILRRDSADLNRAMADAGVRADGQSFRFEGRGDGRGGDGGPPRQQPVRADADEPSQSAQPIETPDPSRFRPLHWRGRINVLA